MSLPGGWLSLLVQLDRILKASCSAWAYADARLIEVEILLASLAYSTALDMKSLTATSNMSASMLSSGLFAGIVMFLHHQLLAV